MNDVYAYIKSGRSQGGGVYFWKISGGCLIFEFYCSFIWQFQKFFPISVDLRGDQTHTWLPGGMSLCPSQFNVCLYAIHPNLPRCDNNLTRQWCNEDLEAQNAVKFIWWLWIVFYKLSKPFNLLTMNAGRMRNRVKLIMTNIFILKIKPFLLWPL